MLQYLSQSFPYLACATSDTHVQVTPAACACASWAQSRGRASAGPSVHYKDRAVTLQLW